MPATLAKNQGSAPSIVRVSAAFAATIEPRVGKTMVPSCPDCGPRVERRFEIPLDGARLRGRIDLLLRAAGPDPPAVEIVDIKTAEDRPSLPQHQNQLRLYAQAARTLGLNPVCLVIHDLDSEDGAAIPVEENPRELARFQEDMCRWVDGIRNGHFSPLGATSCRTCDYRGLC